MNIDPAALPALHARCLLTAVIPAKNEAGRIGDALAALARQRTLDGSRLDPRSYEIVVLCNDCTDATAQVARRWSDRADAPAVHVVETALPAAEAHIGTARRALLDVAARRFLGAGRRHAILASTDADSRVDAQWVAFTLAEMLHVDAVAGHVEIAAAERDRMLAPLRLLYDRERTYRRLLGDLSAHADPQLHDPHPCHVSFVGASFAVSAATYAAAGGLPALPRLEDQAFAQRLDAIDARVRHSGVVRVQTSGRLDARVTGGFGSFIAELAAHGDSRRTFTVAAARRSIMETYARAAVRRLVHGRGLPEDLGTAAAFFRLPEATMHEIVSSTTAAGPAFALALERGTPPAYPDEPVESAIAGLRAALGVRRPVAPTLAKTASGAG